MFTLSDALQFRYLSSLVRGVRAKFPCPRCLVRDVHQCDFTSSFRTRDHVHACELYKAAKKLHKIGNAKALETLLQSEGTYLKYVYFFA
jgi:hypothetical protein